MENQRQNSLLQWAHEALVALKEAKENKLKRRKRLLMRAAELKERIVNFEDMNNLMKEL